MRGKRKPPAVFDILLAATALSMRHDDYCGEDPNACTCPMAAAWRSVFDFAHHGYSFDEWTAAHKAAKETAWNRTRAKVRA